MGVGIRSWWLVFGALSLASLPAWGHHSVAANFDRTDVREITGVVTAFHLRNPHSQLEVDVTEDDGSVAHWLVEWGTRNDLIRRGVDVTRIKQGDELKISLIMSRRLDHVGYLQSAVLSDGSTIRDCGYAAFREALVNSEKLECDGAESPK
jgi:Family of unknown function (DUF6152)